MSAWSTLPDTIRRRAASRRHYLKNRERIIAKQMVRYWADPEGWIAANRERYYGAGAIR